MMPKITVLEDRSNPIVKTILSKAIDTAGCGHVTVGIGKTVELELKDLPNLVRNLTERQCLCMGIIKGGHSEYPINKYEKDGISRTSKHFEMAPEAGFMLFDFDDSGFSMLEGIKLLRELDPALTNCGVVGIYSSSSLLFDTENGSELKGKSNYHLYIAVSDLSKMKEYGEILFNRSILKGLGIAKVKKNSGAIRIVSAFDNSIWKSPEREIFEANPICCEGVESRRLHEIHIEDGGILDIDKSISTLRLNQTEYTNFRLKVYDLKNAESVQKESFFQRRNGLTERATRRALKTHKKPREELSKTISSEGWDDSYGVHHCYLGANDSILDENGKELSILDILEGGIAYNGKSLPDPDNPWKRGNKQAGIPGRGIAYIRFNENESMHIFSHYGDVEYHLVWDMESILEKIKTSVDPDELDSFITYVFDPEAINQCLEDKDIDIVAAELGKRSKVIGSKTYGTDSRTIKTKLKQNSALVKDEIEVEKSRAVPDWIVKLNYQYGCVIEGGKARIVTEEIDKEIGKWVTKFTDINELKSFNEEDVIMVGKKLMPKIAAWNRSIHKNKFTGTAMYASELKLRCTYGTPQALQQGGVYNYWLGFCVDFKFWDKPGISCEKILWHIKHVMCSGDEVMNKYLLTWFSKLFKDPTAVGQPYIAIGSDQGAGKNAIFEHVILKLLGSHGILLDKVDKVVRHFNAHLRTNVLAYLDEAIFGPDPSSKGVLKSFINPTKLTERKGIDAVESKNCSKLIFATNEENIANLDLSDRRFVYPNMSNAKIKDFEYFKELFMEIENGGREAFLKYMLEFESDVNLNKLPEGQSARKDADKLMSASVAYKFFCDLVENGPNRKIYAENLPTFEGWDHKNIKIEKSIMFEMMTAFADSARINRSFIDMPRFYKQLSKDGLYYSRVHSLEKRATRCSYETRDSAKSINYVEIASRRDCALFLNMTELAIELDGEK